MSLAWMSLPEGNANAGGRPSNRGIRNRELMQFQDAGTSRWRCCSPCEESILGETTLW